MRHTGMPFQLNSENEMVLIMSQQNENGRGGWGNLPLVNGSANDYCIPHAYSITKTIRKSKTSANKAIFFNLTS
jgi:hypothetical protein